MPRFAVGLQQVRAELGTALTAQLMWGNSFGHPEPSPSRQAELWVTGDELPRGYKSGQPP